MDTVELAVFLGFIGAVTVVGFFASRWRVGNTGGVDDWGLGGRQFGTLTTWFLVGGDFYTAYTIIAVPALIYSVGALGFFALPYTIIVYPFVFIAMPRLWAVCQKHQLVTAADFVQKRYGSHWLACAVAMTGVIALLPYIALQLVGLEVVMTQMGLTGQSALMRDLPVTIAFLVVAAYTYSAGLRAPALIAFAKDVMIYVVVIACIAYIPQRYGGYSHIFRIASSHYASLNGTQALILPRVSFGAYASLSLGSALAAFMYPHTTTSVLASSSGRVIRRNAVLLPAYTFLLGLIAILGIVAIAAKVQVDQNKQVIPALLAASFPPWFVGFCFAGIAIAALVPAAIMSIAAANLFTRNIYMPYINPQATDSQQAQIAKVSSVLAKFAALLFVLFLPSTYAINLQLLGGVWILQTFPAIALGLWGRWLHHKALLVGWGAGMLTGTWMTYSQHLQSPIFPLSLAGHSTTLYIGIIALALNLSIVLVLTVLFDRFNVLRLPDETTSQDYVSLDKTVSIRPSKVERSVMG